MDRSLRLSRWGSVALAVVVSGVVVRCGQSPPPISVPYVAERECPHTWDTTVAAPALAGPITNIPEFHDCQRFIRDDGKTYDSLYAIFAAVDLAARWNRIANGPPVVSGLRTGSASAKPGQPQDTGFVLGVAEVWSDGGTYPSLGLYPGFNCLFLYYRGKTLNAEMIAVGGNSDPQCATWTGIPPKGQRTSLEVRRDPVAGYDIADYPQVARWGWDPTQRQQFLGVACGAAWCEVGRKGFKSPGALLTGSSSHASRVRAIKGWYDEQYIAFPVTASGGVHPSTVWGHAIPYAKLADIDDSTEFQTGRWIPGATISLDPPFPEFLAKFGIHSAAAIGDVTFSMCSTKFKSCPGLPSPQPMKCPGGWWSKLEWKGGGVTYRCVDRYDEAKLLPPGIKVPGTARWRWLAKDETLWMRCAQGCCTVQ